MIRFVSDDAATSGVVFVYYCMIFAQLFAWGEGESGSHVLGPVEGCCSFTFVAMIRVSER